MSEDTKIARPDGLAISCARRRSFLEPLLRGLGQNMAVAVLDTQPERRLNLVEGGRKWREIVRAIIHLIFVLIR